MRMRVLWAIRGVLPQGPDGAELSISCYAFAEPLARAFPFFPDAGDRAAGAFAPQWVLPLMRGVVFPVRRLNPPRLGIGGPFEKQRLSQTQFACHEASFPWEDCLA